MIKWPWHHPQLALRQDSLSRWGAIQEVFTQQKGSLYISKDQSGSLDWCKAPLTAWWSTYLHSITDNTPWEYCEVSQSSDIQTQLQHMHAETHRYIKWMQIVQSQVNMSMSMHSAHTHFPVYLKGAAVLWWDKKKSFILHCILPAYKLESTQQVFRLLPM